MPYATYDRKKVAKTVNDVTPIGTERTVFTSGCGTDVSGLLTYDEVAKLSGLDFEAIMLPIFFNQEVMQEVKIDDETSLITAKVPHTIPDKRVVVNSSTMTPMGVVGKNYEICQNIQAFEFLDSLGKDAVYETAGMYGNKSFICMATDHLKILGDEFKPYLIFLNSFDGSGAVRVLFTAVRLFCSNAINRAIKNGENKISIRHSSSLPTRLEQAKYVLLENTKYLEALKEEAEKLATTPFTAEAFEALAKRLYPVNSEDSELIQVRNLVQFEQLLEAYKADDLSNYANSAYRAYQAVADFESHKAAFRNTKDIGMKNFKTVVTAGMPLLNQVAAELLAIA